jgi:hypothetical protein
MQLQVPAEAELSFSHSALGQDARKVTEVEHDVMDDSTYIRSQHSTRNPLGLLVSQVRQIWTKDLLVNWDEADQTARDEHFPRSALSVYGLF